MLDKWYSRKMNVTPSPLKWAEALGQQFINELYLYEEVTF